MGGRGALMAPHPPGKAIGSAHPAAGKTRCTPASWTIVLRAMISQLNCLSVWPLSTAFGTHPGPEACRAQARSETKSTGLLPQVRPDSSTFQEQSRNLPVTKALDRRVPSRAHNWQIKLSQAWPSCMLFSHPPNLAQGLGTQLVFNGCSLWTPRTGNRSERTGKANPGLLV